MRFLLDLYVCIKSQDNTSKCSEIYRMIIGNMLLLLDKFLYKYQTTADLLLVGFRRFTLKSRRKKTRNQRK